jgi:hypothetical protein
MSSSRNDGSTLKDLAVVSGSENEKPIARGVQPAFNGTFASACDLCINPEAFIEMARLARMSDPGVAQFLDAWDTLSASEQQSKGAADAVCGRIGLSPVDLLRVVADVGFRFAMCGAQIRVALALPSIVERSIETALTDKGIADRKMLFLHSGFLPTPKTSQTAFSAMRDARAKASERARVVSAPSPEDTIRRVANRFNGALGLPRPAVTALPERASSQTFPDTIPEDEEGDGE